MRPKLIPPSRLQPKVPRDLETICLKCLHKQPRSRYASAAEVAEEVSRFLSGEPIRARRVPPWERLVKWVRRRPAVAALGAVSAAAVLCLAAGAAWLAGRQGEDREQVAALRQQADEGKQRAEAEQGRADQERRRADAQEAEARQSKEHVLRSYYALQLARAAAALERAPHRSEQLLVDADFCPPQLRDFTWHYWYRLSKRDRATLAGHAGPINTLAVSAAMSNDHTVRLRSLSTGQELAVLAGHAGAIHKLAFSPDGKLLASVSVDSVAKLWNLATRIEHASVPGAYTVSFAPDGKTLAVASLAGQVQLWDVGTLRRSPALAIKGGEVLAFSPDSQILALTGEGTIYL